MARELAPPPTRRTPWISREDRPHQRNRRSAGDNPDTLLTEPVRILRAMITDTTVRTSGPFQFDHTLAFVAGFSPMAGEQTNASRARTITKAISVGGAAPSSTASRSWALRSGPGCRSGAPRAQRPLDEPTRRAVVERVVESFGARDDLDEYHAVASRDRAFAPLLATYRGLRHVRFPSPFEAACWGVINQRVQQRVARSMKDALVNEVGPRLVIDGEEHRAFPEAAVLADLGEGSASHTSSRVTAEGPSPQSPGRSRESTRGSCGRLPSTTSAPGCATSTAWGPSRAGSCSTAAWGDSTARPSCLPSWPQPRRGSTGGPCHRTTSGRRPPRSEPWGGYWMLYLWASRTRSFRRASQATRCIEPERARRSTMAALRPRASLPGTSHVSRGRSGAAAAMRERRAALPRRPG